MVITIRPNDPPPHPGREDIYYSLYQWSPTWGEFPEAERIYNIIIMLYAVAENRLLGARVGGGGREDIYMLYIYDISYNIIIICYE